MNLSSSLRFFKPPVQWLRERCRGLAQYTREHLLQLYLMAMLHIDVTQGIAVLSPTGRLYDICAG